MSDNKDNIQHNEGQSLIRVAVSPGSDSKQKSLLQFKPVTLKDLPLINKLLQKSRSRTCDYTVGGIFMWVKYFDYQFCISHGTLFIMGACEGHPDKTAFSYPIGDLPTAEAIGMIKDYCKANGMEMNFSAVPEDCVDDIIAVSGGKAERLDDWADYLYDIETLSTLSGKKMSKKRNHVNRFMADNPDYRLEELTPDLIPEVMLFFHGLETEDKDDVQTAVYEREECFNVLRRYSSYPFEGVVLRGEDGGIVAFAVGEVINDTLYVHIEKTDHNVSGANEAIAKMFAEVMHARYPFLKYVNREEDMGDPGLRYAKMSYHPLQQLQKYNLFA